MDKIGWKVVSPALNGGFQSAISHGRDWNCSYAVSQRTVGHGRTPVLAFRTRKAARHFYGVPGYYRVFKAMLENPRRQERVAESLNSGFYKRFWEGSKSRGVDAPTDTLACDAITLLEPA